MIRNLNGVNHSNADSPYNQMAYTGIANLRSLPIEPETMNGMIGMDAAPAVHARALNGTGPRAAKNTPNEPCLFINSSSLLIDDLLTNLFRSKSPAIDPSQYPPTEPNTEPKVAKRMIAVTCIRLLAPSAIGHATRSGGIGWIAASVAETTNKPTSPNDSAESIVQSIHALGTMPATSGGSTTVQSRLPASCACRDDTLNPSASPKVLH